MDTSVVGAFTALAIIIAVIVSSHFAVKSRNQELVDKFKIHDPTITYDKFMKERMK